jgi:TonB family protein
MSAAEDVLISYLLNSAWQIPLLLVASLLVARLVRPIGIAAEHRVWVAALVCQAVLPAVSLWSRDPFHIAWPWLARSSPVAQANVAVQMGPGIGMGTLRLSSGLMAVIAAVYAAAILYFAARFAWRCARVARLTRTSEPLNPWHNASIARDRWSVRLGARPVPIFSSAQVFAPMTVGSMRKRVLIPAAMLGSVEPCDVETAIAHEMAHVLRNDFFKNLLYEMLSLPINYHPAFWMARQRMTETREMICDQMAAELSGTHRYAQSLLRLAALFLKEKPLGIPHALGVFDANTLERRLMKLTEVKKRAGRLPRWTAIAASLLLGLAAACTVLALRFDVVASAAHASDQSTTEPQSVPAKTMEEHVLTKFPPKYPADAKTARIQGKVILDAIISKTGEVENLKVISGPSKLQQSALDAVRHWTYKPFIVNGDPVDVETTVTVTYTLAK